MLDADRRVGETEARRDANPSAFQEVQTVGKHMWGRLEVVAVKINDPVFLESTQEKLAHTIHKLAANTDLCVVNQTDMSFSLILSPDRLDSFEY